MALDLWDICMFVYWNYRSMLFKCINCAVWKEVYVTDFKLQYLLGGTK
jgi:hypothetical protein